MPAQLEHLNQYILSELCIMISLIVITITISKINTFLITTFIMMIIMIIMNNHLVTFMIIMIIMITQRQNAASHHMPDNTKRERQLIKKIKGNPLSRKKN